MAGYNKPLKKTERLHMLISPEEILAIDEWRQKYGFSRSDAFRRLAAMGMMLDGQADALNATRGELWDTFNSGTDHLLSAVKGDDVNWKECALLALQTLGDMAEPLTLLSHHIDAVTHPAVYLRSSESLGNAIVDAQSSGTAAKARLMQIIAAYRRNET